MSSSILLFSLIIFHDKLVAIYQMDKLMSVTIGDGVRVLHLVLLEELKV